MKREELKPFLEREVAKWSAKSYEALREELKGGNYTKADPGTDYHVKVDLLEDRPEYVQVSVAICSERVRWSCYHPLSTSFIVYPDGRVDRGSPHGS